MVTHINIHLNPVEQPEMTWLVQIVYTEKPKKIEWINHELRGLLQLIDKSGQTTLDFFFFFKSKLVEWRTTVFHPDGYLFQTLYLIKKIVLNKHFYRNQEMAALFWLEKNSCTSGLMHNRKCNLENWGGGTVSLWCLFLSSKTETSTSRSTNTPHNCQVRLTRLVFLDIYMVTTWISHGLLRYNTSGKTSAIVAADPEHENSLRCDIDVPSECH